MSRWTRICEGALRELSPGPFMVLSALALHASEDGVCWPTQDRVAEICGMSLRTVQAHLRTLTDSGWIGVKRRGQRNEYSVKRAQNFAPIEQEIPAKNRTSYTQKIACKTREKSRTEQNQEQNQEQTPLCIPPQGGDRKIKKAKAKPKPKKPKFKTWEQVLASDAPDGGTYGERWAKAFPLVDLADECANAWDHAARKKREDMPRYLATWLKRAQLWAEERQQRVTRQAGFQRRRGEAHTPDSGEYWPPGEVFDCEGGQRISLPATDLHGNKIRLRRRDKRGREVFWGWAHQKNMSDGYAWDQEAHERGESPWRRKARAGPPKQSTGAFDQIFARLEAAE